MPNIVSPLSFLIREGDLDGDGRTMQLLETVHRTSLMPVGRGKSPETVSHFKDPTGVVGYTGFGADGWHYENGVKGRTWRAQEVIDDFCDLVSDVERWDTVGASLDFMEGGIDPADMPFGLRAMRSIPDRVRRSTTEKERWCSHRREQRTGRC